MCDDVSCGCFVCDCALTVLLERCRCVTDKTFCVCLGYDWVLWGVNVNICHILNLCTSKGTKLAMPKSSKLIVELCPCHWSVCSLVPGCSWCVESNTPPCCQQKATERPALGHACLRQRRCGGLEFSNRGRRPLTFCFRCALKYQS